jgi:hypothetical protein
MAMSSNGIDINNTQYHFSSIVFAVLSITTLRNIIMDKIKPLIEISF